MEESGKKWIDKKITRRDFLKKAGMTGLVTYRLQFAFFP